MHYGEGFKRDIYNKGTKAMKQISTLKSRTVGYPLLWNFDKLLLQNALNVVLQTIEGAQLCIVSYPHIVGCTKAEKRTFWLTNSQKCPFFGCSVHSSVHCTLNVQGVNICTCKWGLKFASPGVPEAHCLV